MNRTITNIYNLNSDCGKSVTCEGYMLYVDCIKTISSMINKDETCLQFYIIDSYGNVINSNIMLDIILLFSTEYGCTPDFNAKLLDNEDGELKVDIIPLQTSLQNPVFVLNLENEDFTTDINGEYKNDKLQFCTARKNIIDGINVLNVQKSSISLSVDCNYQSRMEIEYVSSKDSDIIENNVTYIIGETLIQRTIQNIDIRDTVEIDGDANRITLLYPDLKLNIKKISLYTSIFKNKGKFQICLTRDQIASLTNGSLKISGWGSTNDGEVFNLGCVKIANIE